MTSATSPYADVTATSPDLLVPLKYASTSADGQILFQDAACTIAVTTAGDPVGGVKYDGVIVATQSTDANRPTWGGESVGVVFDGSGVCLFVPNRSQTNFLHQGPASAAIRCTWGGFGTNVVNVVYASNTATTSEIGASMFFDDRSSQSRSNAVVVAFGNGSGGGSGPYLGDFGNDDIPAGDFVASHSWDMSTAMKLWVDGTEDADTVPFDQAPSASASTDLMTIGTQNPGVATAAFNGDMVALAFYDRDLTGAEHGDVYDALAAI